ncbi:hypothetical protein GIB67_042744 [Kingdonia uniflora]|uniref:DUF7746 domain-containing protein n=1 Tax=Kingdonia uniflora TaxID=39325 RepID=A0A7J7L0Z6_9MAGN|nr:hypothetical protein GIB67_042744 [Kingdonia uniflora]
MFDFISQDNIKIIEQSIALDSECHTLKLLNLQDIEQYLKKYNYLHVGCIQVAFESLTLLGINSSILAYLRDEMSREFKSSLMGIIKTSLYHGPVYFDVYPNLTLSFTYRPIFDAISLRIQIQRYNFIPGAEVIAVIYRIHYKVMNTLCPRAIMKNEPDWNTPGTTVAVHSNCLTTNISRIINWDELSIPTEWVLPRAVVPRPWFNNQVNQITQSSDGDVEYIINNMEDFTKTWIKADGLKIQSVHPPSESLHLSKGNTNSKPLEANAFAYPTNPLTDVNLIIKQNNWTNVSLQTIGNQLNRIEDHIQRSSNIDNYETSSSSSLHHDDIKPICDVKDFKLSDSQDSEFVDLLVERVKKLSVNTLGQTSAPEATSDDQSESFIQTAEASFHKIEYEPSQLRTYYKRPSPQNLLFEDDFLQNQMSYNERTIYEWNIDGLSEYQIYEIIHKILMYACICKTVGNEDDNVAKFFANGFTGAIKGWWDNVITQDQKKEIYGAVKREGTSTTLVKDVVYTLIQIILLHFVGLSPQRHERNRELL